MILGQYKISVQSGQISLMSANIEASKAIFRVFAPSSHSLPVIRCRAADTDNAEIRLHQYESGLASLGALSPLYRRLWNDQSGPLGPEYQSMLRKTDSSTFRIV